MGVELKEPSRMTAEPINLCLAFWLQSQSSGVQPFRFRKIWHNIDKEYVEASECDGKLVTSSNIAEKATQAVDKTKPTRRGAMNNLPSKDKGKVRQYQYFPT
jgi:hypothetical protein